MKVVGTAGHIDHGKSTLVRKLTGINPDRFAEEKARGMTIDLGFAWLRLPSGFEVSIVDVPGHERFVKNMLAGAGGVDIALLVVAADEAVMPQTREHVDILDLLAVRTGVVALTKVDLVDDELTALATQEVHDLLAPTGLGGSPVVPVSAVTGAGLHDLLDELDRAVLRETTARTGGPVYMPVDRVFTMQGFGTVVTGTLHGSRLTAGMEIEIVPSGHRGRIRSLQTHRKKVDEARPGSRVAVNITGISRQDVGRGDVLALPGTVRAVKKLDARLRVLPSAAFPLTHGMEVILHLGAAERIAALSVLEGDVIQPGHEGWVQLRVPDAVPAIYGQRFIVRLPSPARTVAGGELVDLAPRHRRRDPKAVQRLEDLSSGIPEKAVLAGLGSERVRTLEQLTEATGLERSAVLDAVTSLTDRGNAVRVKDSYMGEDAWAALEARAAQRLSDFHSLYPLRRGMPAEELRRKLRLTAVLWTEVLDRLIRRGILVREGSNVAGRGHTGGTVGRRDEADRVLGVLRRDPLAPPSGQDLLVAARTDVQVLEAMAEENEIKRVGEGLYFVTEAYDRMVARTLERIRENGQVTVAELRDEFGTSRKYVLNFLEYLDGQRITRRVGDARVLGSKATTCA